LAAEDRDGAGAGAVGAGLAVFQNIGEEIEILLHGGRLKIQD
jgi:hypothetical protein